MEGATREMRRECSVEAMVSHFFLLLFLGSAMKWRGNERDNERGRRRREKSVERERKL